MRFLHPFLLDESGQDLVEYMLLTTLIGIGIVAGVNALSDSMSFVYASWDAAIQDPAVVEVPDPAPAVP
jgi:Flp pilus assembly pilin Flp